MSFIIGQMETPGGEVGVITGELSPGDRWGAVKARLGIGRMSYTVPAGLYALGSPGPKSRVFVTASYKMSFDCLRAALRGRDAWILVLDTKGINVWCAAGKGTFGTAELVNRIMSVRLSQVVEHRHIVLPQLGAPGVARHEVERYTGFRVRYGPVKAEDLPAYLEAGMKATPEMRRKTFDLGERAVLVPMEVLPAMKGTLLLLLVFVLLGGLGASEGYWQGVRESAPLSFAALSAAVAGGAVAVPLLLPWLPGRAFSLKGLPVGIIAAMLALLAVGVDLSSLAGRLEAAGWLLIVPTLTTFLAMNFTGASTFTSMSGVKREMRIAVPLQLVGAVLGAGLWAGSRVAGWMS